jgi:hypothetical protein
MADSKVTAKLAPFPGVTEVQGPDYRPTGQMPAAVRNEQLLQKLIEQGKETRETLQTVVDGQVAIVTRLGRLETASEERARKHSGGIKRVSSENEDQNAAIGTLVVDVAEIKTALAENNAMTAKVVGKVVDEAKGFMKDHPALGQALIGLAMAAIGAATAWLAGGHH